VLKDGYGNYTCPINGTAPACEKFTDTDAWGVRDLAGNVAEWVEDDWHSDLSGIPKDGSAWVDNPRGATRVQRGSYFYDYADSLACYWRWELDPSQGEFYDYMGARCCKDAP
jgi:formylglycine-generating enzyme required for sulfatase activity